tara:strand:- start:3138 stop:3326 length:189 start_codon:yes stop_codon:yes gene_type:complete
MELYNIYYDYGNEYYYEVTTDNPKKWLDEHNKRRIADGEMEENFDYFDVVKIVPIIYNKENK